MKPWAPILLSRWCMALALLTGCASDPPANTMNSNAMGGTGATAVPSPAAGTGSSAAGVMAPVASGSAGRSGAQAGSPASTTAGSNAGAGTAAMSGGRGGERAQGGAGAAGSATAGASAGSAGNTSGALEKFSFFVTSIEAMRSLSKSDNGFGGNLSYGQSSGLAGADKICSEIAEMSMPGSTAKGWHAFLSAAKGGSGGGPVHAKDRIGMGPWYDRTGRIVAMNLSALLQNRPMGADAAIGNNLPNERGEPNRNDPSVDNHDVITASSAQGEYDQQATCDDWTSTTATPASGQMGPRLGHAWPGGAGTSWLSSHAALGCAPSVSLKQGASAVAMGIGSLGGYGAIYCFALMP